MYRLIFETDIPATLAEAGGLRRSLDSVLSYCIHSEKLQQTISICLSESLTNLVQHNSTNALTIRFSKDNQRWFLEIIDNGFPWNPSIKSSIDINTMTVDEGGRGIPLVQSLCQHINYESDNRKNTLTLSWPRPNSATKPTVLIVEDDASLGRLYRSYLSQDFNIKMAINGLEALNLLKHDNIHLVISDISMPVMDGFALREKLSQQRKNSLIPFIFLTSNHNPLMLKQATDVGIDDYLKKPINKTQLTQCIKRVIKRSEQVHQQITDRIDQGISSILKPDLPDLSEDWKLVVASRNAGVGGGDLLLHQTRGESTVLMLIDIIGHDDSAKFFSYAYTGYLHGLLQGTKQELTPANFLAELSENALQGKLLSKTLLTCCVAKISKSGRLAVASGGHPTPLHITESGLKRLDVGGMLPGLISKTHYQDLDITIQQGERVAFYTDGLFESANDQESRNSLEQELCDLLLSTLKEPIDVALANVMERFDQLTGYTAKDDVTLILLEPKILLKEQQKSYSIDAAL